MKLKPKSTVKNPKALVYKRFTEIDISTSVASCYKTEDNKYWQFDVFLEEFVEIEPVENYISIGLNVVLKYLQFYFNYSKTTSAFGEIATYEWIKSTNDYVVSTIKNLASIDVPRAILFSLANPNLTILTNETTLNSYTFTATLVYNNKQYTYNAAIEPNKKTIVEPISETDISGTEKSIIWSLSGANDPIFISFNIVPTNTLYAKFPYSAKYQTNKYYYAGSFDYTIKGSIEGTTVQYIKGNIIPLTALNIKYYDDNIDLKPDDLVVINDHLFSVENPETVLKQQPKPFKIYFATLNNIL